MAAQAQAQWYAIRTRSRHEKLVDRQLREQGITSFLPLLQQTRRWSDRRKLVHFPLFPGYSFVRMAPGPEMRVQVLRVNGVVGFVGTLGQGTPIPEVQIESLRSIIAANVPFASHRFLQIGERVRIRGGALDGVEGILRSQNGDGSLVVSIAAIQRSISLRVDGYEIEPV